MKTKGKKARLKMAKEINSIVLAPGQWDVFKTINAPRNSSPIKPEASLNLSVDNWDSFLLYKIANELGRKRSNHMTAVNNSALCPPAMWFVFMNIVVVTPIVDR